MRSRCLIVVMVATAAVTLRGGDSTLRVFAQGAAADYERADTLRRRVSGKVFGDRVDPHWLTGGRRFWYRVTIAADEHEFILVDAERGDRRAAFDHAKLAAALTTARGRKIEAHRLPFRTIEFGKDGGTVRFLHRRRQV